MDSSTKFLNYPDQDPRTRESIEIGGEKYKKYQKKYGTPKIKSPKTGRRIGVNRTEYKKLLNEGFPHKILIIGDGYDFENIKNLKNELGVSNTATLLGFSDNPYPYFKAADFYVLSSRYEGFPTVLFEAITLKKRIIASDVSGVREMLEDGKLGCITENSEEGIYVAMRKALESPETFTIYEQNLKAYQMPFNLENSVKSIAKIIDEL